jgi:hypothetical protein
MITKESHPEMFKERTKQFADAEANAEHFDDKKLEPNETHLARLQSRPETAAEIAFDQLPKNK